MLVIERAMQARNDPQREFSEIVVFAAAHGVKLILGYALSAQHVLRALRADDVGVRFQRDVRHVQYVIVVGVRDENEIGARNADVNGRFIGRRGVAPFVNRSIVPRLLLIRRPQRRRRSDDARNVRINQQDGAAVADAPSRGAEIFNEHASGCAR